MEVRSYGSRIGGKISVILPLTAVFAMFFLVEAELDKSWLDKVYDESEHNVSGIRKSRSADAEISGVKFSGDSVVTPKSVVALRGGGGGSYTTSKPSPPITEEDKKIRREWGGNCSNVHWLTCANRTTFGQDIYDADTKEKLFSQLICDDDVEMFPPVCMFNGWTVTRCHLLCMSKECNKSIKKNYDQYVSKDGFC